MTDTRKIEAESLIDEDVQHIVLYGTTYEIAAVSEHPDGIDVKYHTSPSTTDTRTFDFDAMLTVIP